MKSLNENISNVRIRHFINLSRYQPKIKFKQKQRASRRFFLILAATILRFGRPLIIAPGWPGCVGRYLWWSADIDLSTFVWSFWVWGECLAKRWHGLRAWCGENEATHWRRMAATSIHPNCTGSKRQKDICIICITLKVVI